MKQTALLLYGSLIFGLAVTLFGSFDPEHFTFAGHKNCKLFEEPILLQTTEDYKIEKIGLCAGFDTLYKWTSLNNEATD